MKKAVTILLFALLAGLPARAERFDPVKELPLPQGIEVLFTPKDDVEARIIELINAAQSEILVNHYVLTSPRVSTALVEAWEKRRVFVGIILDANPAVKNYQTPAYLKQNHVPAYLFTSEDGYNNYKYILIDRQTVITGSFDLTTASARRNNENVIVLTEASVAVKFYNNWTETLRKSRLITE